MCFVDMEAISCRGNRGRQPLRVNPSSPRRRVQLVIHAARLHAIFWHQHARWPVSTLQSKVTAPSFPVMTVFFARRCNFPMIAFRVMPFPRCRAIFIVDSPRSESSSRSSVRAGVQMLMLLPANFYT